MLLIKSRLSTSYLFFSKCFFEKLQFNHFYISLKFRKNMPRKFWVILNLLVFLQKFKKCMSLIMLIPVLAILKLIQVHKPLLYPGVTNFFTVNKRVFKLVLIWYTPGWQELIELKETRLILKEEVLLGCFLWIPDRIDYFWANSNSIYFIDHDVAKRVCSLWYRWHLITCFIVV